MSLANQPLVIAGRLFRSRLILGTGKFSSPEAMRDALEASGTELVTVALRRADLSGKKDPFRKYSGVYRFQPVFAAS
jgi:thiazole synthase